MAAATISYYAKTPHSIIINAAYDATGTGITINMATLTAACETGPLRKFLSGYTDATCEGLGFTNSDSNRKKIRMYKVSGSAALGATYDGAAGASFVGGSGLVFTALLPVTVGTACHVNFELRCLNSAIR